MVDATMPFECDVFSPTIRPSVLGSVNMEVTPDGATPSFDHGELSGSGDKLHYWGSPIETKNPSGNPRLYAFCNQSVWSIESGTVTEYANFAVGVIQGMFIFPDTAGTKLLIVWFGNSTTGALTAQGGHYYRNLSTADPGSLPSLTSWTVHTTSAALTAFGALNVGPDAFLTTSSTGKAGLGEWKLRKVVQGIYDGTITNSGPAEPVGNGDWPLIGGAAIKSSMIAGTGAGAFYRDAVDKVWTPVRALQEKLAHGLNCKVMVPSENGVIYAMNDGKLFEYDGGTEHEITPMKDSRKPKDTQRGRISFAADRGDVLAVGYEVAQSSIPASRAAALGVRFWKRTGAGSTWAEITTDVTDSNLQTPSSANMNAWGANATDRLLVTSPFPLSAIIPRVTRAPNSAVNSFTNPQGTSTAANTAGSLPTDLGSVIDNTILSVTGVSLALTGFPPAAAEPMLGWTSTTAWQDVGRSSLITLTGLTTIANEYGYEWSPTNTTAFTATANMDEIDVVPARPGLRLNDTSGPFTAANDYSSLQASGMLTEVYFGRRVGYGQYEWSNPYTLYTKCGGVLQAVWTTSPTGTLTNGGSSLILLGRMGQYVLAEGQTRDPRRTRYPRLCQWTTTEPGPTLALNDIVFRETDGSIAAPSRPKRISKVEIFGDDIPPDDRVKPLVRYHHGRGWHKFGTVHGTVPLVSSDVSPDRKGGGYRADMKLLYSDTNQTDLFAPLISRVRITWDYVTQAQAAPPTTPARE